MGCQPLAAQAKEYDWRCRFTGNPGSFAAHVLPPVQREETSSYPCYLVAKIRYGWEGLNVCRRDCECWWSLMFAKACSAWSYRMDLADSVPAIVKPKDKQWDTRRFARWATPVHFTDLGAKSFSFYACSRRKPLQVTPEAWLLPCCSPAKRDRISAWSKFRCLNSVKMWRGQRREDTGEVKRIEMWRD